MKRLTVILLTLIILINYSFAAKFYVNFNQVDINDLIKFVAKQLNTNVVYDGSLRGKISIISYEPVSKKTLWKMLGEAVSLLGGVVYKEKGYIKITSERNLRKTTPLAGFKPPSSIAEPYVLIYRLKNLNPTKITRVILPLLSPKGLVNTIPGTSILVIKDFGENLKRIEKILKLIDTQANQELIEVIPLKHAYVGDVAREIRPIVQLLSTQKGTPGIVIEDSRTNSLIIYASPDVINKVKALAKKLDIEVATEERQFYVIPIKYASAQNIVTVIKSLHIRGIAPHGRIHNQNSFSITADKNTNSIVIYATPEEFEKVKSIISKLDVQRKQVLLATTVVEVSWSKLRDLGVNWQILGKYGGASFGGVSNLDIFNAIHQGKFVMGTFSPSGQTVSIGGVNAFFPDLLFLFSLLEEDSSFKIVSNPKILTLDNQKAEIKVGESVPYTTGITYQTNTLPTVSFDYRDVGLDLTITPHICGDSVRLEISQTLQEVTQVYRATQGTVDFVAPVTSKRAITSQIIVKNGQTVILGGLISKKNKAQYSHVPWISSIPLLGWLFKRENVQDQKTTLFVFITPYIISTPQQLKEITQEHEILAEDLKALLNFKERIKH